MAPTAFAGELLVDLRRQGCPVFVKKLGDKAEAAIWLTYRMRETTRTERDYGRIVFSSSILVNISVHDKRP
jgi:hypothetical protein